MRPLLLVLTLAVFASPAAAQPACDSTRAVRAADALDQEASRPRLAPRKTVVRRWADSVRASCARTQPPPVDTSTPPTTPPTTPPPAPAAFLTFTVSDTVLRVRPATPYMVFAVSRVDSALQQLSDSALVTIVPALSKLWWNAPARRWELYDATTAGTMVVTATYGSLAASQAVRVSLDSVPVPPPPPPDTTTPPPPDTTSPPPIGAGPAELPRVQVSIPPAPTSCTSTVTSGSQLQGVVNAMASTGGVLCLPTGFAASLALTLPTRGCTSWLTIRWADIDSRVPAGTRARPSTMAGAPRLTALAGQSVIVTQPGACRYRLIGLEITTTSDLNALLRLGGNNEPTLSSIPDQIILERSYVHGTATNQVTRCVMLFTGPGAVIDSWLDDCHSNNGDSQAILGGGAGPHLIQNNYLAGGAENIMYGGFTPTPAGLIPADITIRLNHITQSPTWVGKWLKKNLLELKVGRRVLIERNVLEGSWRSAQVGFAVNLKSSGSWGGCITEHVTLRLNHIRRAGSGITVGGVDPGCLVKSHHYTITDNVVDSLNLSPYLGDGRTLQFISTGDSLLFARNLFGGGQISFLALPDGAGITGFLFRDNVGVRGQYGVKGSGRVEGTPSIAGYATGGYVWSGNTLIGATTASYPPGTTWATSEAAVPLAGQIRAAVRAATAGVVVPP